MSHLYRRPAKTGIYWLETCINSKARFQSLKTKDPATAKYLQSKIDQEIHEGKYIIYNRDPLCEDLLKEYLEASQHRKVKKTNKNDKARIKDFLTWASIKKIRQINEKRLDEYLNHRINDNKLALSSANRYISTFKAWLNFAVRRKVIFENPLKYFKGYKPGRRNPLFLSLDDIKKLLEVADGHRLYSPIFTGLQTGMRPEEVFGAEWPDFDFGNDEITVRHGGEVITKSKKERIVPITKKLKAHLLPLRKDSGNCFDPTNYKHDFPKLVIAAGLKGIKFKHLRHTYASHLLMSGVDIYTVSQLLGHSSVKVTEEHYIHLTKDYKKTAVKKLPY